MMLGSAIPMEVDKIEVRSMKVGNLEVGIVTV
jgi:hypothetical protein